MKTEIPITIEELVLWGRFTQKEKEVLFREITTTILRKQAQEEIRLTMMQKPKWFHKS